MPLISARSEKPTGRTSTCLLYTSFSADEAFYIYHFFFRNNAELIWLAAVVVVFFILFRVFLGWFTRYFREINRGIDGLLGREAVSYTHLLKFRPPGDRIVRRADGAQRLSLIHI